MWHKVLLNRGREEVNELLLKAPHANGTVDYRE